MNLQHTVGTSNIPQVAPARDSETPRKALKTEGRLTVPKAVRDALGIKDGDLVECTIRKVKPQGAEKTGSRK